MNPISRSSRSLRNPAKIKFGGVPISVAIPPILADQAILNKIGRERDSDFCFGKTAKTLVAIGSIIIEVAVLEIHMDINPVLIINPANKPWSWVPVLFKIHNAIR